MKQVSVVLSNYTADVSGVCSALYELGGMVVIHDPSGCNSTYNTHDEPRWYEKDSLIFISGLAQMDAIMGNDDKLIGDIVRAAKELCPRFIALVRTPVPLMTGTDFEAIALLVEEQTGIPVYYFPTTGMKSYVSGAGMALEMAAREMVSGPADRDDGAFFPGKSGIASQKNPAGQSAAVKPRLNILGATPLDFSVNTTMDSLRTFLQKDFEIISTFAYGSTPEDIQRAGEADVNLVISSVGLPAARVLKERFGTPYVVGMPVEGFKETVREALLKSIRPEEKQNIRLEEKQNIRQAAAYPLRRPEETAPRAAASDISNNLNMTDRVTIIGEAVISQSLRAAIYEEYGTWAKVICPLPADEEIRGEDVLCISSEEEITEALRSAGTVIADPIYRKICPEGTHFIPLPHEAYSGRIYRKKIPDLLAVFESFS